MLLMMRKKKKEERGPTEIYIPMKKDSLLVNKIMTRVCQRYEGRKSVHRESVERRDGENYLLDDLPSIQLVLLTL